ncbi:galectin-9-like [Odocoileus virginianus]|uniref:Galectin n=1 Tax=Odocoileus virginianus TaxID=9874 RepID=A0ABM4J3B7_ODOVR
MQSSSVHIGDEELAFRDTQPPYTNPPAPFTGLIEGGLQDGHKITIMGSVLSTGENSFAVNFQMGYNDSEIAFHFNPQFEGSRYVVCNMKQPGNWGPEEKKMQMPFQKGSPFEICFEVERSVFKVMVNKNIFMEYAHCVPFHPFNGISIKGGVHPSCLSIQVRLCTQHSSPGAGTLSCSSRLDPRALSRAHGGDPLDFRFVVNFQIGFSDTNNIAFYFNHWFGDDGYVVCNARQNGSWGPEERKMQMPFQRGIHFELGVQDADSVGPAFCAFPAEQLRQPGACGARSLQVQRAVSPLRPQPQFLRAGRRGLGRSAAG